MNKSLDFLHSLYRYTGLLLQYRQAKKKFWGGGETHFVFIISREYKFVEYSIYRFQL